MNTFINTNYFHTVLKPEKFSLSDRICIIFIWSPFISESFEKVEKHRLEIAGQCFNTKGNPNPIIEIQSKKHKIWVCASMCVSVRVSFCVCVVMWMCVIHLWKKKVLSLYLGMPCNSYFGILIFVLDEVKVLNFFDWSQCNKTRHQQHETRIESCHIVCRIV